VYDTSNHTSNPTFAFVRKAGEELGVGRSRKRSLDTTQPAQERPNNVQTMSNGYMAGNGEEKISVGETFGQGSGTASLKLTGNPERTVDGSTLAMIVFLVAFFVPIICCFPKFYKFVRYLYGKYRSLQLDVPQLNEF
jgi:hypothetical protein